MDALQQAGRLAPHRGNLSVDVDCTGGVYIRHHSTGELKWLDTEATGQHTVEFDQDGMAAVHLGDGSVLGVCSAITLHVLKGVGGGAAQVYDSQSLQTCYLSELLLRYTTHWDSWTEGMPIVSETMYKITFFQCARQGAHAFWETRLCLHLLCPNDFLDTATGLHTSWPRWSRNGFSQAGIPKEHYLRSTPSGQGGLEASEGHDVGARCLPQYAWSTFAFLHFLAHGSQRSRTEPLKAACSAMLEEVLDKFLGSIQESDELAFYICLDTQVEVGWPETWKPLPLCVAC
jgi:hypothetical protein